MSSNNNKNNEPIIGQQQPKETSNVVASAKRSNNNSKNNKPNAAPDNDEELTNQAPTKVPVPMKASSILGSNPKDNADNDGGDTNGRSKSWLQRAGIAPLGQRSVLDNPERSPIGAVRQSSGLTVKVLDTARVKESMQKKEEEDDAGIPWHQMSVDELQKELELPASPDQGITEKDHAARVLKYGENKITPKESISILMRFLNALLGGFQIMMLVGSILAFIVFAINPTDTQTLTLAIVLFAVVMVTCGFQAFQEGKADDIMGALRAQLADKVTVLRDGKWISVDAVALVPGDYVEVQSGEKVPADLRIVWASDLKVNNASLTGENVDIKLGPDANHNRIFEAKNIARSGCNFTSGKGRGIVFATGDNTFFGQIAFATTQTERPDTLMKREIGRLVIYMSIFAGAIGAIFLGLSLGYGYNWQSAVTFTVGIIVGCVPEGLLVQLTVALAITANKLLEKQVLVTNLEIIETLGAVTVICSDKTGTLTCNRMTVSHAVYASEIHSTEHAPKMEGDTFANVDSSTATCKQLLRCANLCSDAIFTDRTSDDILKWVAKGDASESAIVKFVQGHQDLEQYRKENPRKVAIPFNSTNKYMLSVNALSDTNGDHLLTMKGAPERILDRSQFYISADGKKTPFDKEARETFEKLNETLGKRGERVIAFAELILSANEYGADYEFDAESEIPNFPMNGLTLLGFISMIDPPRATVPASIQACHKAGVQVFMVTGDHPITALAIAKSLGLVTQPTAEELKEEGKEVPEDYCGAIAIHGTELAHFNQDQWDHVLKHKEIVFARTQPQQKQDIVRQLTAKGHICAMTGDGVNDAPALKAAHVGVAMGSGAQVAKEAAQIVLLEDDFSSIVDGVREGRTIFENMKKTIWYVLISNIPELVPFLIFIAGGFPLGIETIVIVLVAVGTDIFPAVALAYEEPEDAIMEIPPRGPDAHLVTFKAVLINYGTLGLCQAFALLFAFSWVLIDAGFPLSTFPNAGIEYRATDSDVSDEQREFFKNWCGQNVLFTGNASNFDECRDYRMDALERAQGAGFLTIVWAQVGNLIAHKATKESSLGWYRLTHNIMIPISIVFTIGLCLFCCFTPGLNEKGFLMRPPSSLHASVGLWILPFMVIYEEIRKWLLRKYPNGCLSKIYDF